MPTGNTVEQAASRLAEIIKKTPGYIRTVVDAETGHLRVHLYSSATFDPTLNVSVFNGVPVIPDLRPGVDLPTGDDNQSGEEYSATMMTYPFSNLHNAVTQDPSYPRDLPDLDSAIVGQILVMQDDGLFYIGSQKAFDLVHLCQRAIFLAGDQFDFITFVPFVDGSLPVHERYPQLFFSRTIYNTTQGINHPLGHNLDERVNFGTKCLLACQVLSGFTTKPLDRRRIFHEVAHTWCSYVRTADFMGGDKSYDLLMGPPGPNPQLLYHWGAGFDDQKSPLDYDKRYWAPQPANQWRWEEIDEADYKFCNLDLYLMGVLPRQEVGPFQLLVNIQPILAGANPGPYTADARVLTVDNIINAEGPRIPESSGANYRQLFVVLCQNLNSGKDFAAKLEAARSVYEPLFHAASERRINIQTSWRA